MVAGSRETHGSLRLVSCSARRFRGDGIISLAGFLMSTALSLTQSSRQIYGDEPSVDGCPLAEGELESAVTGNMFVGLRTYYEQVRMLG